MRPSPSLSLRIRAHAVQNDTPNPKAAAIQASIQAAYYRGGTSRAVFFQPQHLPQDRAKWPGIFLQIMGSGDLFGRQLDGMGAGISSLSKICLVEPYGKRKPVSKQAIAERLQYRTLDGARDLLQKVTARGEAVDGIDIDYTFVGLGIENDEVDVAGNCGNMSSAIGPYAYNAGLLPPRIYARGNGEVTVRIRNTNTGKMINATFDVAGGQAAVVGNYTIDGVTGPGSKIKLDFEQPYGSKTGKVLPTGNRIDRILDYRVSCVDGANPCIFIRASDVGVDGTILPNDFNKLPDKLALLESIRKSAAVIMGIAANEDDVPRTIPKIGLVSMSSEHSVLSGQTLQTSQTDLVVRFLSDTQPHRAIPLTAALTTAVAARIPGTIVEQLLTPEPVMDGAITIGHASGRLQVDATMDKDGLTPVNATVYRTAKRLFEGTTFWVDNMSKIEDTALRSAHGKHGTHSLGMAFVLERRGQSAEKLLAGAEDEEVEQTEQESESFEQPGFTKVRKYSSTGKYKDAAPAGICARPDLVNQIDRQGSTVQNNIDPMPESNQDTEVAEEVQSDHEPGRVKGREWHRWAKQHAKEKKNLRMDAQRQERRERKLQAAGKRRSRSDHIFDEKIFSSEENVSRVQRKGQQESNPEASKSKSEGKIVEVETTESEEIAMKEMIDRDRARETRWARVSFTKKNDL
ncbi:3-methylitaconate isomerase [Stagonosporopsis vannaccii]|nr:3-methylitaconate isomerase [Stagonosporopsis vannaccii]